MNRAWDELARLREVNAKHRKGWHCLEATQDQAFRNLVEEVGELSRYTESVDELCDVITVAFHYLMILDIPREQAEDMILDKLAARFSG